MWFDKLDFSNEVEISKISWRWIGGEDSSSVIWWYEKNWFKLASVEEWKAPRRHTALIHYDDPASWKGHWKKCLHLQRLLQILILVKLDKSQKIFSIWSQLLFNKACMYKNHDKVQFYIIEKWWPHQFTVMEF